MAGENRGPGRQSDGLILRRCKARQRLSIGSTEFSDEPFRVRVLMSVFWQVPGELAKAGKKKKRNSLFYEPCQPSPVAAAASLPRIPDPARGGRGAQRAQPAAESGAGRNRNESAEKRFHPPPPAP